MSYSYKCSTCGETHDGLPFTFGSPAPAMWFGLPEDERDARAELSSDQCIIDEKWFFILGRIEIPVTDADENFYWLAWVSVSEANFLRMSELWETPGRENEPPYFGWLNTSLPCYDESTIDVKTNLHTRPIGERPLIELEPTDHPLAVEQRNGINLARVQQIAEQCLHS